LSESAIRDVVETHRMTGDGLRCLTSKIDEESVQRLALDALNAVGVNPMRGRRPSGSVFENGVIRALRRRKVGIRRSIHLHFGRKTNVRITHLRGKELAVPVNVQITIDWDNAEKMMSYRDFVLAERPGRGRRLYVQVDQSTPPETAAAYIVEWAEKLQTMPARRLEGIEIVPEGASLFRVDRRIASIESLRRFDACEKAVVSTERPLDHTGRIISIDSRYAVVEPDDGGSWLLFHRRQVASSRILSLMEESPEDENGIVHTFPRDRYDDAFVAFAISDHDGDGVARPHDLVLLAG